MCSFFDVVITSEDVERSKPYPDIFLLCLKEFGLDKDACVVVEDAGSGIDPAADAGLDVVAVFDPRLTGAATWSFPDLDGLVGYLLANLESGP